MKNEKWSALNFGLIDQEALKTIIEKGLSRPAILIYCFMTLNCDVIRGRSHQLEINELSKKLNVHRTTIVRAWTELSDAGLIKPRKGGLSFDLPHVAAARAQAKTKGEEKRIKRLVDKEVAIHEKRLKRKLRKGEISTIRQRIRGF